MPAGYLPQQLIPRQRWLGMEPGTGPTCACCGLERLCACFSPVNPLAARPQAGIAHALQSLEQSPASLDLTGKVFVLIGATSEMGPLEFLLKHNATVVGARVLHWLHICRGYC